MNADSNDATAEDFDPASQPGIRVVVAYEDFLSGTHALRTLERLLPDIGQHQPFGLYNVWKFDFLAISKLREIAATEAANADLIVISPRGTGALPSVVKSWVELWLKQRATNPAALVTLLTDDGDEDTFPGSLLEGYLQDCAMRARMDFIVHKSGLEHFANQHDLGLPDETPGLAPVAGLAECIRPTGGFTRWWPGK